MIEVQIVRAKKNLYLGKNGTIVAGELYFVRQIRNKYDYVILSEEGHWTELKMSFFSSRYVFKTERYVYMKSRKRLNEIFSVQEYLDSDEMVQDWGKRYYDISMGSWRF